MSVNAGLTRSTSGMDIPMTLSVHSLFSIFFTSRLSIIIPFRLLLLLIDPFFTEVRAGSASHSFFSPSISLPFDVLVLLYLHSLSICAQATNNVLCESARSTFIFSIIQICYSAFYCKGRPSNSINEISRSERLATVDRRYRLPTVSRTLSTRLPNRVASKTAFHLNYRHHSSSLPRLNLVQLN